MTDYMYLLETLPRYVNVRTVGRVNIAQCYITNDNFIIPASAILQPTKTYQVNNPQKANIRIALASLFQIPPTAFDFRVLLNTGHLTVFANASATNINIDFVKQADNSDDFGKVTIM